MQFLLNNNNTEAMKMFNNNKNVAMSLCCFYNTDKGFCGQCCRLDCVSTNCRAFKSFRNIQFFLWSVKKNDLIVNLPDLKTMVNFKQFFEWCRGTFKVGNINHLNLEKIIAKITGRVKKGGN